MRCYFGFHDSTLVWDPRLVEDRRDALVYKYCRRCHKTDAPAAVLARWMTWALQGADLV